MGLDSERARFEKMSRRLKAPNARSEIVFILKKMENVKSFEELEQTDYIEYFMDDLPYDYPYDSSVGFILFPDEITTFRSFMGAVETFSVFAEQRKQPEKSVSQLANLAGELWLLMSQNDEKLR